MSNRRAEDLADGRLAAGVARVSSGSPVSARTAAGLLTLLPVAATTLFRVAYNAPGRLPAGVTEFAALALPVGIVGPALAGLLLAATADAPGERVGLAFAGGFGLVSLASPMAWIPAAAGTVFGGGLAVSARLNRRALTERSAILPAGVAALLTTAVVVSLAATAGVEPGTLRPVGSALALAGVGLTPALVGTDRASLIAGALAGVVTFALAGSAPYVAGSVLLVGGGVVGAPLALVAVAVAGGVAGLVEAVRRGRADAALGVGLLIAAGVPASLLRGLGVVVAVALLADANGGETA